MRSFQLMVRLFRKLSVAFRNSRHGTKARHISACGAENTHEFLQKYLVRIMERTPSPTVLFVRLAVALLAGALCGYIVFVTLVLIWDLWLFFLPETARNAASGGAARLMGSWAFVILSIVFHRSRWKVTANIATWLGLGYFVITGAALAYGAYLGVVGSYWYFTLMSSCGIAGITLGRLQSKILFEPPSSQVS
jgi:hypothetical protein